MNGDTTMSLRRGNGRTTTRTLGLAASAVAVVLGVMAPRASASHDRRDDCGIVFSVPGFRISWGEWGDVRHAPRVQHPHRVPLPAPQPPLSARAEFERGLDAGWALGRRVGWQDGFAGRPECLTMADNLRPRERCSQAYLEGLLKGYRKGYNAGHHEGRQARYARPWR